MTKTSRNYLLLAVIIFIVSFFYLPNGKTQGIEDYGGKFRLGGDLSVNTFIPKFDTTKPKKENIIYPNAIYGTEVDLLDAIIKTDTNKYKYFLKLPYDQNQFKRKIDTIYQITMLLGKSMSVDQSEQYKSLILSVLNNLSKDAKIDSTKVAH